jgi:hypothetical protein
MSYKKLFWGVLLIVIGILFILKNMGVVYFSWSLLFNMWPLLLILWGISIIPVHALIRLSLSVAAVIAAFALVDSDSKHYRDFRWNKNQFHFKFDDDKSWEQEKEEEHTYDWSKSQKLTANYEDVANASLEFDAGAGTFSIEGNSGEYLAVFHKKGNAGRYSMKTRTDGDHQHIDFKLKNKNIKIPDNEYNSVEALLHTAPAWDFDFNIGAAEIDFDLLELRVKTINIDGGASSISVKLGDRYKKTDMVINAGASDIKLQIPSGSGARIEASTFLTGRDLKGFTKQNGYYVTDNYQSAAKIIDIRLQAAISNFSATHY